MGFEPTTDPINEKHHFRERNEMSTDTQSQTLTDGFHLVIDALKLNGINTIYGVPGIPITDLGRFAQAAGMRVIAFRHEQHPATPHQSPAS